MAADGQQALRHGPIAVGQGAFHQRFKRQQGLQFAPQGNAFEQGAALVDAGQAVGQGGVQVEVRIDKRRRQQQTLGVHHLVGRRLPARLHFDDAAMRHANRHVRPSVRQMGMGDEQVQHVK